jgi:hypothetical protein
MDLGYKTMKFNIEINRVFKIFLKEFKDHGGHIGYTT